LKNQIEIVLVLSVVLN